MTRRYRSPPPEQFVADSPLEEDEFEPPVPLGSNTSVSTGFAGWRGGRSLFRKAPRLRLRGDRQFESVFLQQRVRRNRWLGNACGAGTMLHGAPTVHPGMAASRPLRERRLFLTDVKERCCCPYPAVARRRTQRLQSRPPQRRADDKGGKDRDASWARGVSRLKSHTTRGDAER